MAEKPTYLRHDPLTDASGTPVSTGDGAIVVKVQTALNDTSHPALIYDRDRAFLRMVDADQVEGRMQGKVKVYFYARLSSGQIVLDDEAPAQDW